MAGKKDWSICANIMYVVMGFHAVAHIQGNGGYSVEQRRGHAYVNFQINAFWLEFALKKVRLGGGGGGRGMRPTPSSQYPPLYLKLVLSKCDIRTNYRIYFYKGGGGCPLGNRVCIIGH